MTETKTTPKKRARRSTLASRKLEAARQRLANQLAEERDREERIKQALQSFMDEGQKIAAAEEACEEKVAELERRIERLREKAQEKVAGAHIEQARAALATHEAGRTVEQVAELLEVSQKEARRLIAAGRGASAEPDGASSARRPDRAVGSAGVINPSSPAPAIGALTGPDVAQDADAVPDGVGEQRDLRRVHAPQDDPNASFVPTAAAHGGSEEGS